MQGEVWDCIEDKLVHSALLVVATGVPVVVLDIYHIHKVKIIQQKSDSLQGGGGGGGLAIIEAT